MGSKSKLETRESTHKLVTRESTHTGGKSEQNSRWRDTGSSAETQQTLKGNTLKETTEQEEEQEKNTKNATSQDEGAEKDQPTASNPTKT